MTRKELIAGLLLTLPVTLGDSMAHAQKPPAPRKPPVSSAACQPQEGINACETCHENHCCAERRACEADAACAAFLDCLRSSCPTPPCNGHCGLPPPAYVKRFVCQMEQCNTSVCGGPVDACTFCTSTRCAKELLSCLNQPGCDSYTQCTAACGKDSACKARCRQPSSAALAASAARTECTQKECGTVCQAMAAP